jgi:hypothetical protein
MATMLKDSLLPQDGRRPSTPKEFMKNQVKGIRSSALQKTGLETPEQKIKRLRREKKKNYFSLVAHAVVGSIALIVGGCGIFVDVWILQRVAMVFPCFLGPFTFLQRQKIVKWGNIRQMINLLRGEVNEFMRQNHNLEREQNRLERSVSK